jgi:hypothetical protein
MPDIYASEMRCGGRLLGLNSEVYLPAGQPTTQLQSDLFADESVGSTRVRYIWLELEVDATVSHRRRDD